MGTNIVYIKFTRYSCKASQTAFQMKGNTDKCHLLMRKYKSSEIHTGESIILNSDCEKLKGLNLIKNLISDGHDQCKKAFRNLVRANP